MPLDRKSEEFVATLPLYSLSEKLTMGNEEAEPGGSASQPSSFALIVGPFPARKQVPLLSFRTAQISGLLWFYPIPTHGDKIW